MGAVQKRVFRIEQHRGAMLNGGGKKNGAANSHRDDPHVRHNEIMAALHDLRERIEPQEKLSEQIIEDYKNDIHEAGKIKEEMNRIYEAKTRTKQEIVTLHKPGCETLDMGRMSDELSAIVSGTEQATDSILHAAELIDSRATGQPGPRPGHPGAGCQDFRGLQLPGPHRPACHQGRKRVPLH